MRRAPNVREVGEPKVGILRAHSTREIICSFALFAPGAARARQLPRRIHHVRRIAALSAKRTVARGVSGQNAPPISRYVVGIPSGILPYLNISNHCASFVAEKMLNSAKIARAKSTGARPLAVITWRSRTAGASS